MSQGQGRLAGKVAVVTASTDGIGLAIARRLGQDGAKVVISSRKQGNVDAALKTLRGEGLTVSGLVCHVAKAEDRKKLIEQTLKDFGGIDILVSNAAVNPYFGPMLNTPEAAWDKIFEVNVKASFLLVQEIVPHIEKRGGGSIVLVSSVGGYVPNPLLGAYGASKTALFGMTKALVPELASRNIRINLLSPGLIQTRFSEALWKNDSARESVLSTIPMGRMGSSEDCSGTVSFLVSQDASYITGESIVVSGGLNSRL